MSDKLRIETLAYMGGLEEKLLHNSTTSEKLDAEYEERKKNLTATREDLARKLEVSLPSEQSIVI